MLMKSAFFWDITQRRMVIRYRRFGATYRSHLQGLKSPQSPYSPWTYRLLKMGPIRFPETSVKGYHSTWRIIPEEGRSP
jgi:hypothetical protein